MMNRDSDQIVCQFINNAQDEFVTFLQSGHYLQIHTVILTMVSNLNKFGVANVSLVVYQILLVGICDILL